MNNLTNEQKARIFAMHLGCSVCGHDDNNPYRLIGVDSEGEFGYLKIDTENSEEGPSWEHAEFCLLLLRPLSAITDEDAIKLIRLECINFDKNYTKVPFTIRRELTDSGRLGIFFDRKHEDGVIDCPVRLYVSGLSYNAGGFSSSISYKGVQWLISKGYAIPLFIAPNHPDNGKTAIELRLAIDITKQNG